jgi:predicted nuclease of predicted toxin-antitoxin system
MRFLIDQDVFAATARLLKALGHDAVPVADIGLSKAADETLLKVAQEQKRILVTRDRDYGSLVFLKSLGAGVLYLRMLPNTQDAVHAELTSVLGLYSQEELGKAFVVIEAAGHRIRRLLDQTPQAKGNAPPK